MAPKKAKAAVFTEINGPFEVKEFDITDTPAGMARLKLAASGVCGTDIHIHRGKLGIMPPKVIGHEFIGKIDDISDEDSKASGLKVGDYAIVDIASPCGECLLCKTGDDANCVNMGVTNGGDPSEAPHFWGGYGEYNYSPVKNLIKMPADLDPEAVCVFACPGPTALHAFRLADQAGCNIKDAETAVVQGLGPVGTFAVIYLASLGIKNIIALTYGNNTQREELALKLGATEVINLERTSEEELIAHVNELSHGLGADVVFEASGSPAAVPVGMTMLRNRGVYLVPGQYSNSGGIEIQPQMITFKALHIIGSSQYSVSDVEFYLEFLSNNKKLLPTIKALGTAYHVDEINKAFDDAKQGKNVKTLLH